MNELTIEEKAKRFDEAIEVARKIKNGEPINVPDGTPIPIAIFPELKESEDDTIKKEIISAINLYCREYLRGDIRDKMLAWVKKKSEHHTKVKIGEKYKCINSPIYTCFSKGLIYEVKSSFIASLIDICSDCFELVIEEKTPVHKPKFKIGDTIKDPYGDIYHIIEIGNDSYKTDDSRFILFTNEEVYTLFNPAWSKDDEKMLNNVIDTLKSLSQTTHSGYAISSMIKWLKSLKERIQLLLEKVQVTQEMYNEVLDKYYSLQRKKNNE